MTAIRADDLRAVLNYLELDDATAGVAFGLGEFEVADMRAGRRPVPFFVSAMTTLMCESPKATPIALEHGLAMREGEMTFAAVLANATGVGVLTKPLSRPDLRLVTEKEA